MPEAKRIRVPQPRRAGPLTFENFCDIIREDQKADLIEGVIYLASPENTDANDLFVWLIYLISGFVEQRDLGQVFGSRVALRLNDKNGPEPDVLVVRPENLGRVERGHIDGACNVAFEIVSPESVDRDYHTKRTLYERFGVPEYWIIDEELERATLLRLGAKGYTEARPRKGVLASKVLPDFWLRPVWIWQQPRRKKAEVLAEILAGPPG